MVWYLSTLAVVAYGVVRGFLVLRAKRGYRDFDSSASFLDRAFAWMLLNYLLVCS